MFQLQATEPGIASCIISGGEETFVFGEIESGDKPALFLLLYSEEFVTSVDLLI